MKINVRTMTAVAMLCAVSYIFMFLSNIIPAVQGFLQYDAKDVVVTIGGFIFGPIYAVIIAVIVAFFEFITVSHTGPIGLLMNILSTVSFCYVAAFIYHRKKTLSGAFISLVFGAISMTVVMLLWNYFITPMYMKVPRDVVVNMLPTVFLPFNLVKGIINSGFILFLYRPVVVALQKAGLVPKNPDSKKKKIFSLTFVVGIIVVAIFIPIIFIMAGKV